MQSEENSNVRKEVLYKAHIIYDCFYDLYLDKKLSNCYLGDYGRERKKKKIKELLEEVL